MYKPNPMRKSGFDINQAEPGKTLEEKVEELVSTKEPLEEGTAPLIFTPRVEGIRASTNIRTDRWEIAIEATDKIAKSYEARREERAKAREKEAVPGEAKPATETTQLNATESTP